MMKFWNAILLCIIGSVLCQDNAAGRVQLQFSGTEPRLPFSVELANPVNVNGFAVTLQWNIDANDLVAKITLAAPGRSSALLNNSFVALGIGEGMLHANFLVCYNNNDGTNSMRDFISSKTYGTPQFAPTNSFTALFGSTNAGIQTCVFKRPLKPSDPTHPEISLSSESTILWSFHPNPPLNRYQEYFSYHGERRRGAVKIDFLNGGSKPIEVGSYQQKQLHGFGMLVVWMVIFPMGTFAAKYCRAISGYLKFKVVNQLLGIIGMLIFLTVAIVMKASVNNYHSIIGIVLIALTMIQMGLGITTLLGFSREQLERFKKAAKLYHLCLGYILLVGGAVQSCKPNLTKF
jgi:hypothetical protein